MPTTSNFGWTTPADTDLVKDGAAAIRTLGNGIDTSFIDLKGGTTGQVLSKASNTDLDFTWSSVDPLTILDAKGDLITATAADTPARLAVGTNGHILTADSTTSTGLKWAAPASGGKVLQVVQATYSTATTSTSNTYTDTGLTASITPSANTSKILVLVSQPTWLTPLSGTPNGVDASMRLVRGSTAIFTSTDVLRVNEEANGNWQLAGLYSIAYLDDPATTSSTAYKTQQMSTNSNTVQTQRGSITSSIILLEIGA